jgi:hypothetical protein
VDWYTPSTSGYGGAPGYGTGAGGPASYAAPSSHAYPAHAGNSFEDEPPLLEGARGGTGLLPRAAGPGTGDLRLIADVDRGARPPVRPRAQSWASTWVGY